MEKVNGNRYKATTDIKIIWILYRLSSTYNEVWKTAYERDVKITHYLVY